MVERLRIFISSPGDVPEERLRAHLVIQKLARDYGRFFKIEAYLWEYEPMLASGHFQDAIEPPSACDVMVLIVWSRLGTALPDHTQTRHYQGIDGRSPVTGTEWEFEEALAAHRAMGAPDLLAYRKLGDPGTSLADAQRRAEQERQWDALEAFWHRHFEDSGLFLAGSARFASLEEFDRKLEADLTALIERRIAALKSSVAGRPEPIWYKGSPFRGLAAYDFDDAPIFFGRDADIREGLTRLQEAAARQCAFLLVLGASGAGKSSFAHAGLVPALLAPKAVPGVGLWRRVVLRPGEGGEEPVLALARALVGGDAERGVGLPELLAPGVSLENFAGHLAAAPDDASFPVRVALGKVADLARARTGMLAHEAARLVLVVDQLEELFTRRIDPGRRELFLRVIAGLARSGTVWVVATMRNDFWHRAAETPGLLALVETGARLDLLRPSPSQAFEIIRGPAAAAGISFEKDAASGLGLDAVIASAAADEPGALPLLSVMLEALYRRDIEEGRPDAPAGHVLRFATYHDMGKLEGAIARRAEQVFGAVEQSDPEAAAAFSLLLRALVTVAAAGEAATARPAPLADFAEGGPQARLAAAMLAPDARLLVAAGREGATDIRVAHEALLDRWPRAAEQIARDRRDFETRARLESLLHRWRGAANGGDKRRALLAGLNLAEGADLAERWRIGTDVPLGAFVHDSMVADRGRRRLTLLAGAALVLIFAGIAAVAGLQWQRATSAAAAAQRESARAVASETSAVAALRETRKEAAHTLAVEADGELRRGDARGALEHAVRAAEIEAPTLVAGEAPASEAVLSGALGDSREMLHVRGLIKQWAPFAFADDRTFLYLDPRAGLVAVDLATEARLVSRTPIDGLAPPLRLAVHGERGVAVVATKAKVLVIDYSAGRIVAQLDAPANVSDIDIDAAGHRAVLAAGDAIGFLDLDQPKTIELKKIPEPRPGIAVGQARFARDGTAVLLAYSTSVLEYDLASAAFAGPVGELHGDGVGLDAKALEQIIGGGIVTLVKLMPDTGDARHFFEMTPLDLRLHDPAGSPDILVPREDETTNFLGIDATDESHLGHPSQIIVTKGWVHDEIEDLRIYYAAGSGKLVHEDGRLLPTQKMVVASRDLDDAPADGCTVSRSLSFVACSYQQDSSEGLVVWRLGAGSHRFERRAAVFGAHGGVYDPSSPRVLFSTGNRLVTAWEDRAQPLAELPNGFVVRQVVGRRVALVAAQSKQAMVMEIDATGATAARVFGPAAGQDLILLGDGSSALIVGAADVSKIEIPSGHVLWTAPVAATGRVWIAADAGHAVVPAAGAAYVLDLASGRVISSQPFGPERGKPAAISADGSQLALLDEKGHASVLDIASGKSRTLSDEGPAVTALAFARGGDLVVLGHADGTVTAVAADGHTAWACAPPVGAGASASSYPGQPPQGTAVQVAVTADGGRLAVAYQDMRTMPIVEASTGRRVAALTSPWAIYGMPAHVAFESDGAILTTWAINPLMRANPNYGTLHVLPRSFAETLEAAQHRLAALARAWPPEATTASAHPGK